MFDIKDIKLVAFDLDGTVYYGDELIEGANSTVDFFRNSGCKICFLTNNSAKTRVQIYEKLQKIGVKCEQDEVMTSGFIAADYIKRNNLDNVFVFGSDNLIDEFRGLGINIVKEEYAENMVIGFNPTFGFDDLSKAVRVALKAKTVIACNKEKLYPDKNKVLTPGCGAMVSPVEFCADRKVDIVTGKPNVDMLKIVAAHFEVNISNVLMIGDTYESDIAMAINANAMAVYIGNEEHEGVTSVRSIKEIPLLFSRQ